MTKRIAIIGATISGNHGAEAMLSATIGRIKELQPDASFVVFSYLAKKDREITKDTDLLVVDSSPAKLVLSLLPFSLLYAFFSLTGLNAGKRLLPRDIRLLSECDLLIDLAGVSFIDGREKFLPFNILTLAPAFILGVPVVKFSQAMGPFRNPLNFFMAKHILSRCEHLFARGEQTAANLSELPLSQDSWQMAGDLAFLLKDEDRLTEQGMLVSQQILDRIKKLRSFRKKIIGICPSSVVAGKAGNNYTGEMAQIVERLIGQGYGVALFPNATREEHQDRLFNNDLPILRQIRDNVLEEAREYLITVEQDIYANDIRKIIAECETVVVSRFHAMVMALGVGIPPIVVGWSHKYVEVMRQFKLEGSVSDFETMDIEQILKAVNESVDNKEVLSGRIIGKLPEIVRSSQTQIDYVSGMLSYGRS